MCVAVAYDNSSYFFSFSSWINFIIYRNPRSEAKNVNASFLPYISMQWGQQFHLLVNVGDGHILGEYSKFLLFYLKLVCNVWVLALYLYYYAVGV